MDYFAYIYADFPDVLARPDIMEMTGLSSKTILDLLKAGELKSISSFVLPKLYGEKRQVGKGAN